MGQVQKSIFFCSVKSNFFVIFCTFQTQCVVKSFPFHGQMIIKIDISNSFNTTCRALTIDVLSGHASRDYGVGLKNGDVIPTCENLSNLFGYFKTMRT